MVPVLSMRNLHSAQSLSNPENNGGRNKLLTSNILLANFAKSAPCVGLTTDGIDGIGDDVAWPAGGSARLRSPLLLLVVVIVVCGVASWPVQMAPPPPRSRGSSGCHLVRGDLLCFGTEVLLVTRSATCCCFGSR